MKRQNPNPRKHEQSSMTAEPTDGGLVERARTGDAKALTELFRRYAPQVYEVAMRITRSRHDAEDVTQNVFIGLPEALGGYSGAGELGAWIRRIATRSALLLLRQERRQAKWERRAARESPDTEPVTKVEARLALDEALSALPEDLRVVFMLKEVEGCSHDEIADLLGITTSLSSVRLYRARRFLQDRLRDEI